MSATNLIATTTVTAPELIARIRLFRRMDIFHVAADWWLEGVNESWGTYDEDDTGDLLGDEDDWMLSRGYQRYRMGCSYIEAGGVA